MTQLGNTRDKFKTTLSSETKSEIAKTEIDLWIKYTEQRYAEVPEKLRLTDKQMGYVRDPISRVTERKTKKLRGQDIVEAHRLMVDEYDFDIKIDFEGMEKLLHPYHGYFAAIKDVSYSIDEMYDVY